MNRETTRCPNREYPLCKDDVVSVVKVIYYQLHVIPIKSWNTECIFSPRTLTETY